MVHHLIVARMRIPMEDYIIYVDIKVAQAIEQDKV